VWNWDSTPFGDSAPDEDPDGNLENFTLNLRFPGQYYDAESGLNYNYFRDYDPGLGRYIESDPIGLRGGMNTFGYVRSNPINAIDPSGLVVWKILDSTSFSVAVGIGGTFKRFKLESPCVGGYKYQIEVWAGGPAVGGGISCRFCFSAPVSVQAGAGFEDGNAIVPNPDAFNGGFLDIGASAQFLGLGGSVGDLLLGSALGVGLFTPSMSFGSAGLDVTGSIGTSRVVNQEKIKCNQCE
jgi:RHS repeat-associated protein